MSSLKFLAAAIAAATVSVAFAQGTPPNPGATNPAVGAGQRSTQNTPMGATGTPGGGGAAAQGSSAGSTAGSTGATAGSATGSGSTAGATTGGGSSGAMASSGTGGGKAKARKARADRG